jgi:predicted transposase/invertase (TIGR01784 family)
MKFVLEPGKVLKPTSDVVFKNLMKNEKNKDFLAKIISIVTKLDYDYVLNNIVISDTDTLESNIGNHYNTGDLVVNIENTKINIEASRNNIEINKRKNEITAFKYASNSYKKGDLYDIGHVFYQICIENYNIFNNNLLVTEVNLVDVSSGNYEIETEEFKKFHICLNNIDKECYNKLTEEERYIMLLATDDIAKLNKIAGENDIMKKVVNDLIDLSNDSDVISAYEKEKIEKYAFDVALKEKEAKGKKIGIEFGKKEEKIEIAKNLLNENIDINIISKTTGLSLEEINNLK